MLMLVPSVGGYWRLLYFTQYFFFYLEYSISSSFLFVGVAAPPKKTTVKSDKKVVTFTESY